MPAFSRFLRYFVAVGRAGSIRAAAEDLNVSASAIDRQILNVEAELGVLLFERMATGVRLTAAGELMMASGQQWQRDMKGLRARIEDLQGLKRGHVEIAIIDALAKGFVPELLATLLEMHDGITANVQVLENDDVRRAIAQGDVDFGVMFSPESRRDLAVRAFVEVRLGFITPPDHPIASQDAARFAQCVDNMLIAPAPPLAVAEQVDLLEQSTEAIARRKVTSDNVQMIISLVMQELGIGVLTSLDVVTEQARGQIAFTPLADPILRPMTLALCVNRARTPSYAASLMLSALEREFAMLGEHGAESVTA